MIGKRKRDREVKMLPLADIRVDPELQSRVQLSATTVSEYAEAMCNGVIFPPVYVVFDGETYWLWDGFHREAATRRAELVEINCKILPGKKRDALLCSLGANAKHGLQRNNADKRRVVLRLLKDPEWSQWSDREIARAAKVSAPFVGKMRGQLTVNVYSEGQTARTYNTRHGTQATMQTHKIGASKKANVSIQVVKAPDGSVENDINVTSDDQLDVELIPEGYEFPGDWSDAQIEDHLRQERRVELRSLVDALASLAPLVKEEYYTPEYIVGVAHYVSGRIDLDPTSCPKANEVVQAFHFFTREDNALDQDWQQTDPRRVWCNFPYTGGIMAQLVDHHLDWAKISPTLEHMYNLVNASVSAQWFQDMCKFYSAVCFLKKRVAYVRPDGTTNDGNLYAQALFYYGPATAKFIRACSVHELGYCTLLTNSLVERKAA